MTWRLDPPIRVGSCVFAALTKVEITAHRAGPMVVATAEKQPRTILMLVGGEVTALDLDGQNHTPADTAQAYQDAVAQLRSLAADAPDKLPDSGDLDQ